MDDTQRTTTIKKTPCMGQFQYIIQDYIKIFQSDNEARKYMREVYKIKNVKFI